MSANNKELEDLIIEFDEMGYEPTTLCENPQREIESFRNRLEQNIKALQLVKAKSKKNYNLALVVDSGTYEQYCKQFEYFLNDYKENAGAFEIWEDDKYSFDEYNLLREVFVYE